MCEPSAALASRRKMRIVGNSYTVSIPKEIVSFMQNQEKIMNDMVRLCFEDIKNLRLEFGQSTENFNEPNNRRIKR